MGRILIELGFFLGLDLFVIDFVFRWPLMLDESSSRGMPLNISCVSSASVAIPSWHQL